jgi:Kae1-associated kinase Bud32
LEELKVIAKGAEATIYLALDPTLGVQVIKKVRHPKSYRNKVLDSEIRRRRTRHEAKLLHSAKLAGVSVPFVYDIDLEECAITMEYIPGKRLRDVIDNDLAHRLGRIIGMLHKGGIIHGDLTTSNMLLTDHISLIDLSLGEISDELEAKAVDLHVLAENFHSIHTHVDFSCVINGYKEILDIPIMEQIEKVEQRGRYLRRGG